MHARSGFPFHSSPQQDLIDVLRRGLVSLGDNHLARFSRHPCKPRVGSGIRSGVSHDVHAQHDALAAIVGNIASLFLRDRIEACPPNGLEVLQSPPRVHRPPRSSRPPAAGGTTSPARLRSRGRV